MLKYSHTQTHRDTLVYAYKTRETLETEHLETELKQNSRGIL